MFMRTTMIALACVASLGLAGCESPSALDPNVIKFQEQVQKYCGWVEPAITATNIVATLAAPGTIPALSAIEAAARGLCTMVQQKSARKGGSLKYRGVTLQGHFS